MPVTARIEMARPIDQRAGLAGALVRRPSCVSSWRIAPGRDFWSVGPTIMPELAEPVRLDKWLWAVRVYKTRAQAVDACRNGKILLDGQVARASREVRPAQVVTINLGGWTRTLRVVHALEQRVAAGKVAEHAEDLTSPEERERGRERRIQNLLARPAGEGRPTKRERRAWDRAFRGPMA
jgi:ribosome-associated heat shock protein Hsp15